GGPIVLVLQDSELSREECVRLLRRVDRPPGCRRRALLQGGGLRLLWFVVHGPALHEQSVCRPRCAVLAGLVGVRARKERSDKKIAARVGPVERAGRSRYSRPARKATTSPNAVSRCGSCNTS